jgi:hypothetical protein
MKPENFRAPTGVFWVHMGPWVEPADNASRPRYERAHRVGYGQKGGGLYRFRGHAENKVRWLNRQGYPEAKVFGSGYIEWVG